MPLRRRSVVNLAAVALVATSVAIPIGAAAASDTNTPTDAEVVVLNAGGANDASSGLEIHIGGGQLQVKRFNPEFGGAPGAKAGQFYDPSNLPDGHGSAGVGNGTYLWIGDDPTTGDDESVLVGPDNYFMPCNTLPCKAPVSWDTAVTTGGSTFANQSGQTGTARSVLTYHDDAGDFVVTADYSYVGYEDEFSTSLAVTTPAGNGREVKLYELVDSYLLGSDNGAGFVDLNDPTGPFVGVRKFDANGTKVLQGIRNTGPQWAGYVSAYFTCMLTGYTDSGACNDAPRSAPAWGGNLWQGAEAIDTNPDTDNGYGVAWVIDPAGTAGSPITFDMASTSSTSTANQVYIVGEAGYDCANPKYSTIEAAVAAADSDPNDALQTVHVCTGQFRTSTSITTNNPITIEGEGINQSIIESYSTTAAGAHSLFEAGANITLSNLTIVGGYSSDGGGAVDANGVVTATNVDFEGNTAGGFGGAIASTQTVITDHCLFRANSVEPHDTDPGSGGAISALGGVDLTETTFMLNTASSTGGAIYVPDQAGGLSAAGTGPGTTGASAPTSDVRIVDSRFIGNSANGDGGAVRADAAYIASTTFDSNRTFGTGRGGAVYTSGVSTDQLTVVNSTFYGNHSAGAGGAISAEGKVEVLHATFDINSSDDETLAASIAAPGTHVTGVDHSLEVANSMFADVDTTSPSCTSNLGILDEGGNLDTQPAATPVLSGLVRDGCVDPAVADSTAGVQYGDLRLGGLSDNGGKSDTVPIAPGSIAVDHAGDTACATIATYYGTTDPVDQRGDTRAYPCDTGAYEVPAPDDLWIWTEIGPSETDVYGVGTSCVDDSALAMQDFASVAFQYASDHIADSGTIHVCDGYYPFMTSVTVATEGVEFVAQEYDKVELDASDNGGPGIGDRVTIDGNLSSQLFTVDEFVLAVTFRGITFEEGATEGSGGAIEAPSSDVTLDTVAFVGNIAATAGGAVNASSIEIVAGTGRSSVSAVFEFNGANLSEQTGGAGYSGGAINATSTVAVTDSVFYANVALGDADGGAINAGALAATDSIFALNSTSDLCIPVIGGPCVGGVSVDAAALPVPPTFDLTAWAAAISSVTPTMSSRAGEGGAVHTTADGAYNVFSNTLFAANGEFTDVGGAIAVDGTGTTTDIEFSTLYGSGLVPGYPTDVASKGGAVYVANGVASVKSTSIDTASARVGGAIAIDHGHVRLINTGINNTYALGDGTGGDGSAIYVVDGDQSEFKTSYITNQTGLTACSFQGASSSYDAGYNLATLDTTCPGTKVTDADVSPIAATWSPLPQVGAALDTLAMALHVDPASVTVDAIPSDDPLCGDSDQNRVARPVGLGCDIGPWEAVDETVLTGTTGSFTVPNGITTLDILLVGGGGGGAAVNELSGDNGTGGGGGGQVVVCTNISVTPGQVLDYTIGAGGTEGVDGGTTEVTDHDTGFLIPGCTASGGYAGNGVEAGGGGNGSGGSGLKSPTPAATGGGGGGAGGDGDNAVSENVAGNGGSGAAPDGGYFNSYPTLLGGGGGGGGWSSLEQGYGGAGVAGGGDGAGTQGYLNIGPADLTPAGDGTDGTGGGGGGAAVGTPAGSGGDGTIIIRTAVPLAGVDTVTTTQVSRTSFTIGGSVTDTATVTAASPSAPLAQRIAAAALGTPTGDVEWYYCFDETTMPTSCDDTTGTYIDTVSLDINGVATLTSQPSRAGKYLFHAVYLGDDDYNSSADDGTNESFTVNKAVSTILYTGTQYFPSATSSVVLSAQVGGSACRTGSVDFYADSDGDGTYETFLGSGAVSGTTGTATYSWSLPSSTGVFDVEAYYPSTSNCTDAVVTSTIIIAGSGDSSNGGGNYNQNGKVNFGYTLQVKTTTKGTTVTGQMLWHLNGKVRIKGTITAYTKMTCPTQSPSLTGTTCALVTGSGTLYTWSGAGHGGWVKVATGVGFKVYVADGGTSTVCVKKTCSTVLKPDFFKMDVPTQTLQGESTTLQQLTGGNLVVK